jgi:hypothetical protein
MDPVCPKGVVALFIDKIRQIDVETVCSDGLLLWTPISIVITPLPLDRSDHHLKTDRQRSVKTNRFPRLVWTDQYQSGWLEKCAHVGIC